MWLSTTKYFSPFFSYTMSPEWTDAGWGRTECFRRVLLRRHQVEADVFGGVLRVGEHDGPVVLMDHPAVVGGHVLLELGRVEEAGLLAERLGYLVVDDVHPADG